jgi:AcrR family transcriptional regulator
MPKPKTPYSNQRMPRTDGDETRTHIIEAAGQLFAIHGFKAVTSKMICAKAQVNAAAVNYHFGNREGLYRAVLLETHQYLANVNMLSQLVKSPLSPQKKLEWIIRLILDQLNHTDWHIRFYIREAMDFNEIFTEVFLQQATPKTQLMRQIFSQITGLPPEDDRLPATVLTALSPCVFALIANKNAVESAWGVKIFELDKLAQHISQFAWAGIQGMKEKSRE